MSDNMLYSYSLSEALDDGELIAVFRERWPQLSGGKPIVATTAVNADVSLAALREVWNDYVRWRTSVMPTLPEEDQLFATTMNNRTVWVLEDAQAFTILYPEDY